jgi:hypothetical protein
MTPRAGATLTDILASAVTLELATGLDGDCIVGTGHVAVRDPDPLAGVDIDPIAVFDPEVTPDPHTMKYDILAPEQSVRIGSDCNENSKLTR